MVNDYIERELLRKNRGVYFKNGKWVLHLLFLNFAWLAFAVKNSNARHITTHGVGGDSQASLSIVLFALFFYTYCLYLIPACFKRGKHLKFWLLLAASMVLFPLLNIGLQQALMHHYPAFNYLDKMTTFQFCKTIFARFAGYFMGFTSLLYLMELLEEIRTAKEISQNAAQLQATEQQLIKTRMDPAFVIRSLDGITLLAAGKDAYAPDAVIRFSDILRYRLYRSAAASVPLAEELQQLGNLIHFHNSIHQADAFCTLEIEGATDSKSLPPLLLLNMAEALLSLYALGTGWSLLLYLLIEEHAVQIAAELTTDHPQLPATLASIQTNLQPIFEHTLSFTVEAAGSVNSIRICLPITNHSTASL